MKNSLTQQEQLEIFTQILLYLQLTYYEGAGDQTDSLKKQLKSRNLSENLTQKIVSAGFKAYIESIGDEKKYFPLCAKYLNASLPNESKSGSSNCFVATAIYGSYDNYEVLVLRNWRDNFLIQNYFGRLLIKLYYFIGPFLANLIRLRILPASPFRKILDLIVNRISESRKYKD